jgi:hypothetical protein
MQTFDLVVELRTDLYCKALLNIDRCGHLSTISGPGVLPGTYLEQAMKAQSGSIGVALYSFFNLDSRRRWMINATPRSLYARVRDPELVCNKLNILLTMCLWKCK